ncbi:MAG TPA: alpha/beta fold hydrolase [Candidatus Binatia bacterium]|nr:alpha/beta fold hydrolase [Candidatus Binatia bacterium]
MRPETRYAQSSGVNIAYQVIGDGPLDLVFVPGWVSNIEYLWEESHVGRFLWRLASMARLILFDKRGTGLSDRAVGVPGLEERMDDLRAVMDAVGSRRAALVGLSEAGAMCALFAATYPERTSALVLIGCVPRRLWAPDYPWGETAAERARRLEEIERAWGTPEAAARDLERRAPSVAHDPWVRQWWATYLRQSASPKAAAAVLAMNDEIDVRPILPSIRVPTLVIHRSADRTVHVEAGRDMAARIPGARYVELPGDDHLPFFEDQDAVLGEIAQFLTGVRPAPAPERVLVTLLSVEVVGARPSTDALSDRRWEDLVGAYLIRARQELARFRGSEIETSLGRLLASFDGPARAVTCAGAIVAAARSLGLDVRAGLHTGECELTGAGVQGIAVHVAGQVMASAAPGEVLVSGTVRDLVAGSGLRFEDLAVRVQPGPSGGWRLHRVLGDQPSVPAAAPIRRDVAATGQTARLTPREREVAALVTQGLTNRQIAETLTIAESTAERHVINILNKLGLQSRAQIAAWTAIHGPGGGGD